MNVALSAQIVAELVGAGLGGQALVDACRRIEDAAREALRPLTGAERTARWRARKGGQADGGDISRHIPSPMAAFAMPMVGLDPRIPEGFSAALVGDEAVTPASQKAVSSAGQVIAFSTLALQGENARYAIARDAMTYLRQVTGCAASVGMVGARILDHYNRRTGRCDPSVGRLAEKTGLSVRTVRRAVAQLDALGLIRSARHGGRALTNAFRPDFAALDALVAQATGQGQKAANFVTSTQTRPSVTGNPDNAVTQTLIQNPDRFSSPGKQRASPRRGVDRLAGQRELLGPAMVSSSDAHRQAAERRVWESITAKYGHDKPAHIAIATAAQIPGVFESAATSEGLRRGSGLAVIEAAALAPQRRTGTGPP